MKYIWLFLWGLVALILVICDLILYIARLSWELKIISWNEWVNGWAQIDSCNDRNPFDTWLRYYKQDFLSDPE